MKDAGMLGVGCGVRGVGCRVLGCWVRQYDHNPSGLYMQ